MRVLVTGGAGFIGSAVVRYLVGEERVEVLNVDKLTYASNLASVAPVSHDSRYALLKADICDSGRMAAAFADFQPDGVIHLAAETHVDRSITGSAAFIETNIVGTYVLLEAARRYFEGLPGERREEFRFLHVSTDEVYGSLGTRRPVHRDHALRSELALLGEQGRVRSSGAGLAPHLRAADHHLQLLQQLRSVSVPRKADPADDPQCAGGQAAARLRQRPQCARLALCRGSCPRAGSDSAPRAGRRDLQRRRPQRAAQHRRGRAHLRDHGSAATPRAPPSSAMVAFVTDRPGHDQRYAIDASRLERELGWRAKETFDTGIEKTVRWYLDNANGGKRCGAASMAASGSALRRSGNGSERGKDRTPVKVLVTGREGQLARGLAETAGAGVQVVAIGRPRTRPCRPRRPSLPLVAANAPTSSSMPPPIRRSTRPKPSPTWRFAVNARGGGACRDGLRRGAMPIIHISTDYVFDGAKTAHMSRTIRQRRQCLRTVQARGRARVAHRPASGI